MMKRILTFGFAATALAACSPAPEPSRDAPGVAVEVVDAPARPAAEAAPGEATARVVRTAARPVELRSGSLCEAQEQVVWSCRAGRRTISICASRDLDETQGYAQYRIGRPGALEMEYPATRVHPRGRFTYTLYAQGNQTLDFSNGGYDYRVFEDLRSREDGVYVERNGGEVSQITCDGGEGFGPVASALGE